MDTYSGPIVVRAWMCDGMRVERCTAPADGWRSPFAPGARVSRLKGRRIVRTISTSGHFTVTIPAARAVPVSTIVDGKPVESVEYRRTLALVPSEPAIVSASTGTRARPAGRAIFLRSAEVPAMLALAGASILAPRFANVGAPGTLGPLTDDEHAAVVKLGKWQGSTFGKADLAADASAALA